MNERTRIVACAHVSTRSARCCLRVITRPRACAWCRGAHRRAQAVPHQRVDLAKLDCDFYAFGAQDVRPHRHRCAGRPQSLLEAMPPQGGDMILTVS
jgi:hypothetical protein